jgi:hypothetical protein
MTTVTGDRTPFGSAYCDVYGCDVQFFIEQFDGGRNLVAQYGPGYTGRWLPLAENGRPEFGAIIPPGWTDEKVSALILTPPVQIEEDEFIKNYPTWEVGGRYFGSHYLAWPTRAPKLPEEAPRH